MSGSISSPDYVPTESILPEGPVPSPPIPLAAHMPGPFEVTVTPPSTHDGSDTTCPPPNARKRSIEIDSQVISSVPTGLNTNSFVAVPKKSRQAQPEDPRMVLRPVPIGPAPKGPRAFVYPPGTTFNPIGE